jgi:glycosyltransferase involved in cell wall biosynthesis
MSAQGRFILIDHSLVDYSGHHYEYARAVLDAAAADGRQAVLVTNRKFTADVASDWPIYRAYKYGVWFHQGAPNWQIGAYRALGVARRIARRASRSTPSLPPGETIDRRGLAGSLFDAARQGQFIRDTRRVLQKLAVTGDDLVFVPTLSFADFAALCRLWQRDSRASCPDWHVVFRRSLCRLSLRERAFFRGAKDDLGRFRFWTDSEELTAEYRRATGRPFGTLPIPHAAPPCHAAGKPPPLRILSLGDARLEKGFQHLPGLVRSLTDGDSDRGQFEFYIQSHSTSPADEPQISSARAELARLANRGVTLFGTPLPPAQYRELLASGHLVVLPYDPRAYAARSSGIFAEAMAAGIPTVVPAGTWMARYSPTGAGETFRQIEMAPAAVRRISADYGNYVRRARIGAAAWRRQHHADRLVSLLREASREPVAKASSQSMVDLCPSIA